MTRKPARRVTLQDVAKHAGVSRATASLIVRNSPKVAAKTREKVLKSIDELGYVYDRVAANLRSQKSSTIGTIITDVGNTFFSQFLLGVHHELEKYGYTVLLGTTFDSLKNQERLISTMLENRVGGILLCPVSTSSTETVDRLKTLDIPVVVGIRELNELTCDFVGLNYQAGAYLAVNHLIQKGHQQIAFIGGISDSTTWTERMEGYRAAHEDAGLSIDYSLILDSAPTREGGMEAIQKLIQQDRLPKAIFCFSDLIAFGVIIGLRKMGITPGKDIDIVGFDNIPEAEISYPPLTTVSSFAQKTGTAAASLLHNRMQHPEEQRQRIIIEPELIKRDAF
ncbi:LacI family DNA-binding transcriptional regulator [Oceanobacillus jeddahense]|uniref:LacI family DNA-binding transcriptional regulator n=1 Tax=Oceanobacillus jeddahense TaxID=1462527 RepID=A0ABY5JRI8_9BACI|nr:LacI family DNA-binding transcriptional regulator [Oceanobacillus jeddahense]UUI02928.1 LacI family DNA-binding transcriptional regulator [Oceanobacillus jeddahense]